MSLPSSLLTAIEPQLQELSITELKRLQKIIAQLIKSQEDNTPDYCKPGRQILDHRRIGRTTYQLEKIKCGKPTCRCAQKNGDLHGPYWYLYEWNGEKIISQYIGKKLPSGLDVD
ncbi:MAG: DUF6788 family protein [Cyanobacteria bacterium P01_E01_bin.6]